LVPTHASHTNPACVHPALTTKVSESNVLQTEIDGLKNLVLKELPERNTAIAQTVEQQLAEVAACRRDLEAKQAGRQLRKNEMSKGVTFYKERLGLSFERMPDNSLSLRMTLIDPENWARAFSFAVLVNSKDKYEVLRCEPKVDYDALLTELNDTNNFSQFVQKMRRKFKALV